MNNYTQEERNAIKALENEVLEILREDDPFCKDIYNRNLVVWTVFEDLTTVFYANRIK